MVVSKVVVVSTVACHRSEEGFNVALRREVEEVVSGDRCLIEHSSSVGQEEVSPVA